MPTKAQKAARRSFAAKARSGRGKVGKAAKSTASPRKKRCLPSIRWEAAGDVVRGCSPRRFPKPLAGLWIS
jgi:hypothetical protein